MDTFISSDQYVDEYGEESTNQQSKKPSISRIFYPGAVLNNGKYKLEKMLGKGRFSHVWLATHTLHIPLVNNHYSNKVAIKVYKDECDDIDYFVQELRANKQYENFYNGGDPNETYKHVVSHIDAFIHMELLDNYEPKIYPCIVFEYLGEDIYNVIKFLGKDGYCGFPLYTVKKITRQIVHAVSKMHKLGLIHTDIKLENVLITKKIADINDNSEIDIKIADLGGAVTLDNIFTLSIGTRSYNSPEVIMHLPFDSSVDVWAIMCLLFELITGDSLFKEATIYDNMSEDSYSDGESSSYDEDSMSISGSEYSESDDELEIEENTLHLRLIETIIGGLPKSLTQTPEGRTYYNNKGKIKGNPVIERISINDILLRYGLNEKEAREVEQFMLCGLRADPKSRYTCEQLLEHPFLK